MAKEKPEEVPAVETSELQPRRRPAFHPVLIEVAGCMEDETVRDVTQRLRRYRNRYQPLLRCMFTLVATAVPEARLFGDTGSSGSASTAPLFTAPQFAVSVNKTYPLVRRFHPSVTRGGCGEGDEGNQSSAATTSGAAVRAKGSTASLQALSSPIATSHGASETPTSTLPRLPWADDAAGGASLCDLAVTAGPHRAVRRLEDFMAFHFLPFAMTHNTPPSPGVTDGATAAPSGQPTQRSFVLRHYINEASRTSSFLFADPYHAPCGLPDDATQRCPSLSPPHAVLVDPREEQLDAYRADLTALGATLSTIIFTHCYVDGSSGLSSLTADFPSVRVVSGLPLLPAGTARTIAVSAYLSLRTVAVPAFSPECLLVEVHAGGMLVGLCTGVLWSTDAAPRWDLLQWSSYPAPASMAAGTCTPQTTRLASLPASTDTAAALPYGGGDRDAALVHTHRVLKEFFFTPYLAPLCSGSSGGSSGGGTAVQTGDRPGKSARTGDAEVEDAGEAEAEESTREEDASVRAANSLRRVVLLPTHGGYSNVTNQLDLYWGAHLGDLARMKHARTVIDTLATDAAVFVRYNKRLPRLPHPPLFDASRIFHLRQLLDRMGAEERSQCVARLPPEVQLALANSINAYADVARVSAGCSVPPPASFLFANAVDVRDAKDYHALHLSGSVNVPMSFPGTAYGARRAELWLQCVLVPHQPILVLCAAAAQKAEVQRRLAALSPGCTVVAFTLEDVPELAKALQQARSDGAASAAAPWREIRCERPGGLPAELPIPTELVWIQHAEAMVRLTTYEHLVAIEPTDTRVVLDVRTPYEFKNGSHQHSVHVELSEMCTLAVEDAMKASSSSSSVNDKYHHLGSVDAWRCQVGSSPRLADVYMEKVHTNALLAGLPIARQETSLSDVVIYCAGGYRSLIAASLMQRAMEASANAAWRALHIADVSGGAFQIMTQRPDLWRVKDRSIICIS